MVIFGPVKINSLPRILLFISLLFTGFSSLAQPKQYSFTHHGTNEGLASHEVYSIVQDENGYLWIGTNNGLQRFDGTRYRSFRFKKGNPASIPHNDVYQVHYDKRKNLWILTKDGKVGRFDTKTFKYIESNLVLSRNDIRHAERTLLEDEEGNVFLSYAHFDFLTWDETNNEFSEKYTFLKFPTDWQVSYVVQQKGTRKYFIGGAKGLAVYDRATDQLSYQGHNTAKESIIETFGKIPGTTRFFIDSKNRLWFDSWLGSPALFCFDLKNKKIILNEYRLHDITRGYHEIRGIMQQKDGTIWIKGLGVFARYLEKEKRFEPVKNEYRNEQSIDFDKVNDLCEDIEQNVWVATNNNGVYRFNPASQFFTNIRQQNRVNGQPGEGSMMSFLLMNDNTLLAGAWSDGLYRYDSNFNMLPLGIRGFDEKRPPFIWSMVLSKDNNTIWMGSQPGIFRINQARGTSEYYNPKVMQNRTVRQVVEDKFGNVWMGTQSVGLFKWDSKKGNRKFEEGVTPIEDIPPAGITRLLIDKTGYLWVATMGHGLYVVDPATEKVVMHLGTKEPSGRKLLWDGPVDVLQYDDSTIVIASNGIHLFNTRKQAVTRILNMPESIPNAISAIQRDKTGYLWISTTSGLFRVNLQNQIFIHFDRIDGIGNDRFVIAASYVMPDGRILFGADNQFVMFHPSEVQINEVSPDVTITGFQLMNKPLQVDSLLNRKRVELSPVDNSIAIEFSGLRYNGTYIIKYKLEGLDKDWIIADKTNQAIYSYLPPGTYTFLLQSQDAEGNLGKNITRLEILINPPFWRTWWFFCLLALGMAAIFYWLDRERMNKLKALQTVRTEIAGNLHEEVNTTLNNINLLSEMARIKADKDINRSKEFIDQISTKSHNMIIAMDDILWSIDPQNDNMQKSLLRMMEFMDSLKNRHGANIELALDKKVRSLRLDMKTRHEVFLIFKEALRMIVQYAGGKDTLIHIDLFKNKLSLKLQDATADLDLNHLAIDECIREMHSRASFINAELDVQYDKTGVAIILLVPV